MCNRKTIRSPVKHEEFEKVEESNKMVASDRDLDRDKEKLELELREKQDRLKKLIREKNLIERNLEEKYENELKSKKQLTMTLLLVLAVLVAVFMFQSANI